MCVCVCLWVCLYACIYVCMYICMYVYIYIYIHIHIHTHKEVRAGQHSRREGHAAYLRPHIHVYTHKHIHMYIRAYLHTNLHTHNNKKPALATICGTTLHIYIYIYIYIIHTNIHTYINKDTHKHTYTHDRKKPALASIPDSDGTLPIQYARSSGEDDGEIYSLLQAASTGSKVMVMISSDKPVLWFLMECGRFGTCSATVKRSRSPKPALVTSTGWGCSISVTPLSQVWKMFLWSFSACWLCMFDWK